LQVKADLPRRRDKKTGAYGYVVFNDIAFDVSTRRSFFDAVKPFERLYLAMTKWALGRRSAHFVGCVIAVDRAGFVEF
jgi:hypothetical protein